MRRFFSSGGSRLLGALLTGLALLASSEARAQSTSCAPGQYGILVASWPQALYSCQACPPGYYSPGGTVTSCTPCARGYFQPYMGQPGCYASNPGSYVPSTGMTAPSTCPAGTASSYAAAGCTPCPTGYTSPLGSASCVSSTGQPWSPPPPTPTPAPPSPTPLPPTPTPAPPTATPAPPPSAPAAPTNVTAAQASDTAITVKWSASTGATSYTVVYSKTSGGPWTPVGNTTSTSFTMQGLSAGVTYYFAVYASNAYGQSPLSAQVARKILLM